MVSKQTRAAAGQQYAIVVGLVAVIAVLSVTRIGGGIGNLFGSVSNRLTNVIGNSAAGGGAAPAPALNPGNLTADLTTDYGSVSQGSTASLSFTFTAGNSSLSGVYASVSGTGIALGGNGCGTSGAPLASLAANATCPVTVNWTPSATGSLSNASIAITSNAGTVNLALTGTGGPALGGNCVADGSGQLWCIGTSQAATGISVCGHPSNYSGTYFTATQAAATALGKSFTPNVDCATNYTNTANTLINGTSLACWSNAQRWARPGTDSSSFVVVRCVNLESNNVGLGPVTTSNFGTVPQNTTVTLDFQYSVTGNASVTNVAASVAGPGITLSSNGCGTSGSPLASLNNNASCLMTVSWTSSTLGALSGASLTVTSSAGSRTVNLSGSRTNLPSNCAKDTNNQVWCYGTSLAATGITTCGYTSGYSGTYYAITSAGATALGKGYAANQDCATNYMNSGNTTVNGASLTCWTNGQRWARPGTDSGTPIVVRCTNME